MWYGPDESLEFASFETIDAAPLNAIDQPEFVVMQGLTKWNLPIDQHYSMKNARHHRASLLDVFTAVQDALRITNFRRKPLKSL